MVFDEHIDPGATGPTGQPGAAGAAPAPATGQSDEVSALQTRINELEALVKQAIAAPAPKAEPPADRVGELAKRLGMEPGVVQAIMEVAGSEFDTRTQGMGGTVLSDAALFLQNKGITNVTLAELNELIRADGVTPSQWMASPAEDQVSYLESAADRVLGRKLRTGALKPAVTPQDVPPRQPGADAALGGGVAGGTSDQAFQDRVRATMAAWDVDEKEATRRVSNMPEYRKG